MKGFAFLLVALAGFLCGRPAWAAWPPGEVHEVRAYVYDYTQEEQPTLLRDGKLHKGVINREGAKLSDQQKLQLGAALTGEAKSGLPMAACYMPHHGFVFYDKDGKPLGHVELCFHCGNGYAYPEKDATKNDRWDLGAMAAILKELQVPVLDPKAEDAEYTKLFQKVAKAEK